jgi:hypothetical protein
LNVGDTLQAISQAGLTLKPGETQDALKAYPAEKLTPELVAAIKQHKADIMKVLREDEKMRRTGILQSERQVLELAREFFGKDGE